MRPDTQGFQPTVLERIPTLRRTLASLVMAAAITLVGCNLDLTNPNNPTLEGCLSNPRACTSRMIAGVMDVPVEPHGSNPSPGQLWSRDVLHVHHGRAVHHGPAPRLEAEQRVRRGHPVGRTIPELSQRLRRDADHQ